jgi:integrase
MMAKNIKKGVAFQEGNSGSWSHRVKLLQADGTTKYSKRTGFKSQAEAEKSYYEYERQFKEACRAYQITSKPDADIGFKDYLIYWFEEIFVTRVENTTHMVCAYALYDLILPHMEQDIKLRYVNVEYLDALLAVASKSSESAGNKSREVLNLAMKEAVIQGYIKTNPVLGTKGYTRKKPTVIVLKKENVKILLSAASKTDWYLEILLALFCGLRKGEIQGLKFQDFDPANKTIHIQRQVTANPRMKKGSSEIEAYGVVEKPPKTDNSYRKLRVPEVIAREIELRQVWVAHNKETYGEAYVDRDYISCQDNGTPHSASAMNAALTRLCKKNGLPHITVHGLRHMYATILIERNVPLVKISALLGHSSVNTTFEYYCDVMDENEQIISFMNCTFIPEGSEQAC